MGGFDADPGSLPLAQELVELYKGLRGVADGALATYIEPLADADPKHFGLAIVTVDGHCYAAGDAAVPFTIQSVSKPFAFGLTLDHLGVDAVLQRVGVEPTGDAFNSITVDEVSGRPFNPMVNAGAIVTTSLLGSAQPERERRMLEGLSRFAGMDLEVDPVVFEAEWRTGDRNRAIAYLMRTFGMLREEVDAAVETYFRQCSVLVDARSLATMGATLANRGVNPLTGEQALSPAHVARVLSVMTICGMYDYAGEWLYRIGLPAKSGVSGGVLAVLPGVLAIGVYSPPLDPRGNSVRGIRACEQLTERFGLHMFEGRASASVVRRSFDGSVVRSKRRRPAAHADVLRAAGEGVCVMELQGPLHFGSAEELSRRITGATADASHLILDVGRVTSVDEGALPVLEATLRGAAERGLVVAVAGARADRFAGDGITTHLRFDAALEQCEDEVLEAAGLVGEVEAADLVDHELLSGMRADEIDAVVAATALEVHPASSRIFAEGEAADSIYFLLSGRVCVVLDVGDRHERIATIGPGGCFGEMAIVDGGVRSASVDVETEATCRVLPIAALARLERDFPGFSGHLCRNLAVTLSGRLRDANDEVRALRA